MKRKPGKFISPTTKAINFAFTQRTIGGSTATNTATDTATITIASYTIAYTTTETTAMQHVTTHEHSK